MVKWVHETSTYIISGVIIDVARIKGGGATSDVNTSALKNVSELSMSQRGIGDAKVYWGVAAQQAFKMAFEKLVLTDCATNVKAHVTCQYDGNPTGPVVVSQA